MIFSSRFYGQCSTYHMSLKVQMRVRMYYRTILVIILSICLLYLFWPKSNPIFRHFPYFTAQKDERLECFGVSDNHMLLKSLDEVRDSGSGHYCYNKLLRDACLLEKSMLFIPLDDDDNSDKCNTPPMPILQDFTIAFVIRVTNDEYHQVERLFINIYRAKHLYFFYVCKECSLTYDRLKNHVKPKFNNVQVEQFVERQTLLEILRNVADKPFDSLINLDQYDFPLAPINQLEFYLYKSHGMNIIDRKQQETAATIIYSKCPDNRRYKIGYENLPSWFNTKSSGKFVLTRTFILYLMKNSTLIQHSIINSQFLSNPEQFLIANVLENSKCTKKIYANIFLDSSQFNKWNFDQSDFNFIYSRMKSNIPPYFMRKVDPRYNQQIINDVESIVNPFFSELHLGFISVNTTLRDYWSPTPFSNVDATGGYFSKFLKQLLHSSIQSHCVRTINRTYNSIQLLQGHMLNKYDLSEGMTFKFMLYCADEPVIFETLISKNMTTFHNLEAENEIFLSSSGENYTESEENDSNPLLFAVIAINDDADRLSYFFRNVMSVFHDTDQLAIQTNWQVGKKNLLIDIITIDPNGQMSLPMPFEIWPMNETVLIPLPLSTSREQRIEAGLWRLQIFNVENMLIELTFYILPSSNVSNTASNHKESRNIAKWYQILSKFYFIRDTCVSHRHATSYKRHCKCARNLPVCEFGTTWSSMQKDLKSDAIEMLL